MEEWEERLKALGQQLGHTPSEAAWIFRAAVMDLSENAIVFLGLPAQELLAVSESDDMAKRRKVLDLIAQEHSETRSAIHVGAPSKTASAHDKEVGPSLNN